MCDLRRHFPSDEGPASPLTRSPPGIPTSTLFLNLPEPCPSPHPWAFELHSLQDPLLLAHLSDQCLSWVPLLLSLHSGVFKGHWLP